MTTRYIQSANSVSNYDEFEVFVQVNGLNDYLSNFLFQTNEMTHLWMNMLTDNTLEFYVDGSLESSSDS